MNEPSAELRAYLPELKAEIDASLVPAPAKMLAVLVSRLMEYATVFGAGPSDPQAAAELYYEVLGELPLDLLEKAVAATKREHKWNTLPRPAEVRAHVSGEWSRRRTARIRADVALKDAERGRLLLGPDALKPAAALGPRTLSAETEALLADMRRRRAAHRGTGGDWKQEPPASTRPRPDLVSRWAKELEVESLV